MPELVLLTGVLIAGLSLYLMIRTRAMAGLLDKVFGTGWLYAAALIRLLLGAMLIGSAHTVAFGPAVEVFGWLFCVSGLTLVVVPRPALQRMVGWFSGMSTTAARVWLAGALLFGLFFVYAYLA
jgi:hypothetical protein